MRGQRSPRLLAEEEGEEELLRQIDALSTRLVRNRSAASFASSTSPAASPSAYHTSPPPPPLQGTAGQQRVRQQQRPLEALPVPLRQRSPSSEYGQGRGGGGGAGGGGRVYHSKAAAGFDRVSVLGASTFAAAGASAVGPKPARVSTVNDSSLLRHPVRLKRTPQTAPPLSRLPVTAPPPPDPLRPSGTAGGARGRSWGPQPLADAPRPSRSPSPVLNSAMRTLPHSQQRQQRRASSPASRTTSPAGSPQRQQQQQPRQQKGADGIVVLHDRVRMSDLVAATPAAAAVSSPLPSTLDTSAFPERVSPAVADRDEYLRQLMGQSKLIKENLDRFCSTSTRRMESSHRDGASSGGGGSDHPHHPRRPLRVQHRYDDAALASSSPPPPATPPPPPPQQQQQQQQPQQPEGEDLRAFLSRKAAAPLSPPPPQPAEAQQPPPPSASASSAAAPHRLYAHPSAPLPPQHTTPQFVQHAPQGGGGGGGGGFPAAARSPPPQETSLDVSNSPAPPSAPSPDRGNNPSPQGGGAMHRRGQRDASYDSVPDTTVPSCQIDLSVTPEAVTPERTQGRPAQDGGGGGGGPPAASAVEELLAERARLLEEQMERDRKLEMVEASLRNLTAQQMSSIASATTTGLP